MVTITCSTAIDHSYCTSIHDKSLKNITLSISPTSYELLGVILVSAFGSVVFAFFPPSSARSSDHNILFTVSAVSIVELKQNATLTVKRGDDSMS